MNVIIIRYNTLHEHILVNGIYVNHTTIRYNIKYTLYFSKTVHCKYDSTQVLVYVKKNYPWYNNITRYLISNYVEYPLP